MLPPCCRFYICKLYPPLQFVWIMKIDLLTEDKARRERLLAIYDHVGEIAKKIAAMDDPLPHQLERSVPSYLEALSANAERLTHSKCQIVIAGMYHRDLFL